MSKFTPEQARVFEELADFYADSLRGYDQSTPEESKTEVRRAWTAFRNAFPFTSTAEADVAGVGALMLAQGLLEDEDLGREEIREILLLLILTLIHDNDPS